ncbi:hypothetical protein ACFKHW_18025 [Bradyrhizobium lupini]|uniref:hypothetical protein n=1 Tax=Bradyrhizobium TaxID=374 RepID=UPI001178B526|nr:hypothetical protein [Bradyrhizobium canariense]MBM7482373.1 hypothetical protein [Bradyrhizobium canariense]
MLISDLLYNFTHAKGRLKSRPFHCAEIWRAHSSGIQQTKASEPPKFRNNSNLLSLSARAMTQMNP